MKYFFIKSLFLGLILYITSMIWLQMAMNPPKNRKYYRKWSNNFAPDYRYSLEGKCLFLRLGALIIKPCCHLKFISGSIGLNCKSILTKRIFNSSVFGKVFFKDACKHQILSFALKMTFWRSRYAKESMWKLYHEGRKKNCCVRVT